MAYEQGVTLSLRRGEAANRLEKLFADPAERRTGALMKLTLKDFKQFNNTFGYQYGDLLLEQIARYLCGFLGAEVFRLSGVEFLLLVNNTSYSAAAGLSGEIATRFDDTWHLKDMDCICGVNIGMLFPTLPQISVERAFVVLDYAARESFARGQNTPVLYDEELAAVERRTRLLKKQLKDALAAKDSSALQVCFRPTVRSSDGRIVRAESALRLLTPEYGTIGASELIPIAEEAGIACTLNIYMLRRVCAALTELLRTGYEIENVTVPLSAVQFLQKNFASMLADLLCEYDLPAGKLGLEITQSSLVNRFARIRETLERVSEMGMETTLSDFGTGCLCVTNILDLPVRMLKLDRLFVYRMNDDQRCCAAMEGLITIAHNLGMKVIAEGVENDWQQRLLTTYSCDYQQGDYYSPTVPSDDLLALFFGQYVKR